MNQSSAIEKEKAIPGNAVTSCKRLVMIGVVALAASHLCLCAES